MNSEIAAALREIADIDDAEGGNPHVIAKEREAASHIEALEAENERLWEFIGRVDTALRYEDDNAVFKSGNSVGAIRKGVVFLSQAKE